MKMGNNPDRASPIVSDCTSTVPETGEQAAERRRKALRSLLAEHGMTLKDAAVAARLGSPGAISNFLGGYTASLNLATLEPLARALKVSINRLVGEPEVPVITGRETYICGSIATGRWRRDHLWAVEDWIQISVPVLPDCTGIHRFLRLDSTEMNLIYAPGTILEVVDLADFPTHPRPGNRVIVLRTNPEGFVEISIREVELLDDDECQLVARSNDLRFADRALPISWPIEPGRVETTPGGDRVEVRYVVVRSIRDEI